MGFFYFMLTITHAHTHKKKNKLLKIKFYQKITYCKSFNQYFFFFPGNFFLYNNNFMYV